MERKNRIKSILSKNFHGWKIEVSDTSILHKGHNNFNGNQESHFCIILDSERKNRESRLTIHKKVNCLLANEFNLGLHALEIKFKY